MSRSVAVFLAIALSGLGTGLLSQPAVAQVPLQRAVIQALRNRVRLLPQNRAPRPAAIADAMVPGDALATARAALAELRFNDGSLARVGEQAIFQFVPTTRTFRLSNGTLLLLIPPGRGGTRIQTPNATAGIKGSALFARYNAETDTTVVGALTNNPQGPIVIYNQDASQQQELRAGQMAVVVAGQITQLYEFDLNRFYETSELVQGLNLTQPPNGNNADDADAAIAQVRAETTEALQAQTPIAADSSVRNPALMQPSVQENEFPSFEMGWRDRTPTAGFSARTNLNQSNPRLSGTPFHFNTLQIPGVVQVLPGNVFPGGGNTGGVFPGGGNTGGVFPGGGNTGGVFPGGGNTGGVFPGGGNTGGVFPGGGNTGGVFPGGGNTGGVFPGGTTP